MLRRVFNRSIAMAVFGMATSSVVGRAPAPSKPAPKKSPRPKSPQARLAKKVSIDMQNVRLEEVLAKLRELSKDPEVKDDPGLKLYIDPVGLSRTNVTLQSKVSLVLNDVPLSTALRLLLGPLKLTYRVRGEIVMVTSPGN